MASELCSEKGKYRTQELHKFIYEKDCICMLLGKDGSEGLDLSFTTHIIFLEQVWDKSLQQQAVSRAYRMGARGSVSVETLIAADTVEDTMLRLEGIDGHKVSSPYGKNAEEIQTIRSAKLSSKEKDYQRAKLHYLLKSLKLIANSATSSFGTVQQQQPPSAPTAVVMEQPPTKKMRMAKTVRFEIENSCN